MDEDDDIYITYYGYDNGGRRARVKDAEGTITRTAFDELGRRISQDVGTNDYVMGDSLGEQSGTNNMVTVTEWEYDGGSDGGDSLTTEVTQHVDSSSGNDRVTTYSYNEWNQRESASGPGKYYEEWTYDRQGRTLTDTRYEEDDEGDILSKWVLIPYCVCS